MFTRVLFVCRPYQRETLLPPRTEEARVHEAGHQGRAVPGRSEHHGLLAPGMLRQFALLYFFLNLTLIYFLFTLLNLTILLYCT